MRYLLFLCTVLLSLGTAPVFAVQPDEILDDPALEQRARALSKDLRCLVCRNESIDDSNAQLARDLRLLVRERMVAGDSDEEAIDYIVDRYGDFVLLNPRMSGSNLIIWLAGPVLLIVGGIGAFIFVRRQRNAVTVAPNALTPEEQRRIAELTRD
ncbi:MAG: cytochrome c-type biogenesis protein [Pseudomonadota bacterium]